MTCIYGEETACVCYIYTIFMIGENFSQKINDW